MPQAAHWSQDMLGNGAELPAPRQPEAEPLQFPTPEPTLRSRANQLSPASVSGPLTPDGHEDQPAQVGKAAQPGPGDSH